MLWDVTTGIEIATLEHRQDVSCAVAFWHDGTILASGSGGTIRLWDVANRREIATFRHPGWIHSLAFSFYDATIASRGWDGTILIWDISQHVTPLTPDPDFDDNGEVDFTDFVKFAAEYGFGHGDAGFDGRYDLDGDGTIGFGDFVIFAGAFGQQL